MKAKPIILFFLLLSALIPQAWAADYGEDEDYLGQIVDDYVNADNVTAAYNVINNLTRDCMELNFTIGEGDPIYEDFDDYTEVDSADDITVADIQISWSTMRRDAISWVVYDFGVDWFGDFQVNFTLDFSDIEAGDGSNKDTHATMMFSNSIGTLADNVGGDLMTILTRQHGGLDDRYNYVFRQHTAGVKNFEVIDNTDYFMARHFMTMERVGTRVSLGVYTDDARTNQIENLTGVGELTAYRYLHVIASYDADADGADHSTGIVANVTFGFGEAGEYFSGYYYTTEILDNDTGLVFMYNATIEANTGITAEFSDDNLTWVDHNDQAGSDTLITGFESLDLRDLNTTSLYMRFNMTTNGVSTPRIYQVRYVTITNVTCENGDGETVYVDTLFPGLAIGIALLIVAAILAFEKRR